MDYLRTYLLIGALFLSSIINAQVLDEPALKRTDVKEISGNNTVSVTSYKKNGMHFVYAGGFGDVDVFELDKEGKLTFVDKQELYKKKGPARGMVASNISGTDFLFVANKFGNVIEVLKILDDGSLERVFFIEDSEEIHIGIGITLQVVHMEKSSYLFAGGLEEDPGLSCFRIADDGMLTHVQSMKDDDEIHTDGIIGMCIHKINEKTFLYTGGFQDNGVSGFRVYENGEFKHINSISDNDTDRYLTGAYPVTGVTIGNKSYVIVGHRHHKYYARKGFIKKTDFVYHGDAVSVFRINRQGELVPHNTLIDNNTTKLSGQTRIEVVSVNAKEAILAVGTRDDASIQLCRLSEDGILSPINYLNTGYSIYYGLRSHTIDEDRFLVAGSNRMDLKKLIAYKVVPEDPTTIGKTLRHTVSLKFKEDANQERIDEILSSFENLKYEIPEVAGLEWGLNNSTEGLSKGFTHCFTLTFNDSHAREIYLFHEAHVALGKKMGPFLDDVLVIDYWTER